MKYSPTPRHRSTWTQFTLCLLLLHCSWANAEVFPIHIGDTIAQNAPAAGAGYIPESTATDTYTFTAEANQLIFIEELTVASAFQGWLQWKIVTPGGATVFNSYFNGQPKGRKLLPESGTYTVQVWVGAKNPAYVGSYAFRLRPIPPDHSFSIQIGDTVSEGVPGVGAGRIEVPGAADLYTFQAAAGASGFFESLTVDPTFRGWLNWELRAPSNLLLFRTYLGNGQVGKIRFPETGTYRLRVWVENPEPAYIGGYSVRIGKVTTTDTIPIRIGTLVDKTAPVAGAGQIETPGAERRYVFAGISGQEVHFDMFEVPASFKGWLKWELKSPSRKSVFSAFAVQPLQRTLEETGDYSLRVWVGISDPSLLGSFAFRTWCEVVALPDSLTAAPGSGVAIPFTSLMCNDSSGVGDRPEVKLISATSAQGGAIQAIGSQLRYTPPSSFTGVDRFQYRLEGLFGGSSTTEVRVVVAPDVAAHAMVVSLTRDLDGGASVCLLGTPETEYRVEQATEFGSWIFLQSVRTDSEGKLSFHYLPDSQLQRFYRFRKP